MNKIVPEFKNLKLVFGEDGIAVLTIDCEGKGANVFTREVAEELAEAVEILEKRNKTPRGLIVQSAKPNTFVAGADIGEIEKVQDPKAGEQISEFGQRLFDRIEKFPFPTVAAIHGAALGGGLEFALACTFRIATNDSSTQLGLPETQLGILPAWGGCVRLPKAVGLSRALALILQGRRLNPKEAKRIGLVDEVVPSSDILLPSAKQILTSNRQGSILLKSVSIPFIPFQVVASQLVCVLARRKIAKDARHYPALKEAISAILYGKVSKWLGFRAERRAFGKLASSGTSKNLIKLFYEQERARKDPGVKASAIPIHTVGVCGAGTMGREIAYSGAYSGKEVRVHDAKAEALPAAMGHIAGLFEERVKSRKMKGDQAKWSLRKVTATTDLTTLRKSDLIIEAIFEDLGAKQALLKNLSDIVRENAVIATNTSTLLISEIAKGFARPNRVIGTHFFNPVSRMKLVEIVTHENVDSGVVATAVKFVKELGKTPIVVKECPGFLVNRVLGRYLSKAQELISEGVSPFTIDTALFEWGMPMGPFELLDLIGLDIGSDVGEILHNAFPDRFLEPRILKDMVTQGRRGRKNGKGFYAMRESGKTDRGAHPKRFDPNAELLIRSLRTSKKQNERYAKEEIAKILLAAMADEAERCLKEGIVRARGDVDLALVLGIGFPPFRGSVFEYIEADP